MSVLLLILGLVLLAVVSSDVLVTTLTVKGGGFLTNRLSTWVWHSATKMHKYNTNHRLLGAIGLLLIIGMVVLWYFLTWMGWSLIFCSFQDAIVNSSDKQPASTWGRIYFTAYTITTLGRGDYLPQTTAWHLLTGLAAVNGFFLVTLSIAYLFPVISAATQKRILSVYLASLGGTGDQILTNAWNDKGFGNLDQHLISLTPLISELSEKHLAYPVLHYFHSRERTRCLPLSIAAFDEALTLLQYGVLEEYRPDPASLNPARRACAAFLKTLKSAYLEPSNYEPPLIPLKLLNDRGVPTVSDHTFSQTTSHINKRRKLLLALVRNDGWSWNAVASSRTTSRSSILDDETTIDSRVLH